MFFAYFYSAPPIRAKVRPVFDMIFSAGHYVATGVFGYTLLTTTALDWKVVLAGVCWCMAMHAYSAVPDIAADSEAKIDTVATLLGARTTLVLCAVLYAASALLTFPVLGLISVIFGGVYVLLMLVSLRVYTTPKLFTLYTYFPMLNAFTGMIIFWYLLLL
jgi:4-hydroxybenzoate polyprenyltransferase